jgi:carbonic anhydrase
MQKLLKGALTFRRHMFAAYRDLFERLAQGQEPEALFITCSDSRVVPNLITATDPGDLFVLRNIGNIIPPFEPSDKDNAEAAAIEYALAVLKVKDIVICGHSRCGAMKAAQNPGNAQVKHVQSWLRHVDPALTLLKTHDEAQSGRRGPAAMSGKNGKNVDPAVEQARTDLLSQINVLTQLKHVKSYPPAMERLNSGKLHLHAWFFEIDSAQLFTYDPVEEQFLPIETAPPSASSSWGDPQVRKSA